MSRSNLKSYVRYDADWKVIPGSNVLRSSKPKDGRWGLMVRETTSTTTTLAPTTTSTTTLLG